MITPNTFSLGAFQREIDMLVDGATLEMRPGEYAGPVIIRSAITLDGNGVATVWALNGPVISIESPGVALRGLRIEVTGDVSAHPLRACALNVAPGLSVDFKDVEVRGAVVGVTAEEGDWQYPHTIELGPLPHGRDQEFLLRLAIPVPCRIESRIAGVAIDRTNLGAGSQEVRLKVDRFPKDMLVFGVISLSTAFLTRRIAVSALVMTTDSPLRQAAHG